MSSSELWRVFRSLKPRPRPPGRRRGGNAGVVGVGVKGVFQLVAVALQHQRPFGQLTERRQGR